MSWLYLTDEQGAILDRICGEFFTGYKDDDCPACPMRDACFSDDYPAEEPDRTEAFEKKMWELAKEATK